MKRFVCVILTLLMLLPSSAFARRISLLVSLGDSIATGYGLDGYDMGLYSPANYTNQLAKAIGLAPRSGYFNLAVDGLDTRGLTDMLSGVPAGSPVAKADAIVISIGGNDLLGLGLNVMKTALGLSPDASVDELYDAIKKTPDAFGVITDAFYANKPAFDQNVAKFSTLFPQMMTLLRKINPDSQMYVLSLYNPFGISELESAGRFLDGLFGPMNDVIKSRAADFRYKVLPVGERFAASALHYTNIGSLDIHPSQRGHNLIFSLASSAMGLNDIAAAKSVNIKKSSVTLAVGGSLKLACAVSPKSAKDPVWSSANDSVVSVDQTGTVTAVSAGSTFVYARHAANPKVFDRVKVTVRGVYSSGVSFTAVAYSATTPFSANGAVEITPVGGSGMYDVSLDGGKSWKRRGVDGKIRIPAVKPAVYDALVADAENPENLARKPVTVGYRMQKPSLKFAAGSAARLYWTGVGESYEVWRFTKESGKFELICVTSDKEFEDISLFLPVPPTDCRYRVRAIGIDGSKSGFSGVVKAKQQSA